MENLRIEINQAPRGTKARIIRLTGLSKPTIFNALSGEACSPATARDIATAYGRPDRWHELVVIKRAPKADQHPSADPAA